MHRDQQLPHQGLRSSHLLLHPDQEERLQAFLLFSCSQRIGASPSKIQQSSIKRPERGGTQNLATSAAIRVATPDSILHHALFVCTAAGRLALHLAVPFANAALAATFARVKLLTPLQITAGVQTAALRNGDAASTALQEAGVAKAAFGARGGRVATVVFLLVGAAGGAGEAAELVVLVEGAHGACRNSRWGCRWGGRGVLQSWKQKQEGLTPAKVQNLPACAKLQRGCKSARRLQSLSAVAKAPARAPKPPSKAKAFHACRPQNLQANPNPSMHASPKTSKQTPCMEAPKPPSKPKIFHACKPQPSKQTKSLLCNLETPHARMQPPSKPPPIPPSTHPNPPPNTPQLTAKGRGAPGLDADPPALAGGDISTDSSANHLLVTLVKASIEQTVLKVRLGVDDAVAAGKGPPLLHQQPAVLVAAVAALLRLAANSAVPDATRVATGDVGHFPGVAKVVFIHGRSAVGGLEVVVRVAVGVAAKTADGAGVSGGEDEAGVAVPIEGDDEAEVGLEEGVDAAGVGVKLGAVAEGEVDQEAVDLEGRRRRERMSKGGL